MWSIVPTLIAGWIALAQVLSFAGLAIWVITGSLLAGWLVLGLLRLRRVGLALFFGVGLTLVLPVIAEKLGGTSSGPVTRATLMSVGVTVAMSFIARTRYPAWMLLPSLALLGGSLGLGAAGHAAWVVAAWIPLACWTLLAVGPYSGADLAALTRRNATVLMVGAAGLVAVLVLLALGSVLTHPWTIDGSGIAVGSTSAAPIDPTVSTDPTVISPEMPPLPSNGTTGLEPETSVFLQWWVIVLFWLVAVCLVLGTYVLIERVWIRMRWFLLSRRLRRQEPRLALLGSWSWLRLRMARADDPLGPHESPDVVAEWAVAHGDEHLAWLAEKVTFAAYDTSVPVSRVESRRAWRIAEDLARDATRGGLAGAIRRSGREP
jgi:hypothetical protein